MIIKVALMSFFLLADGRVSYMGPKQFDSLDACNEMRAEMLNKLAGVQVPKEVLSYKVMCIPMFTDRDAIK